MQFKFSFEQRKTHGNFLHGQFCQITHIKTCMYYWENGAYHLFFLKIILKSEILVEHIEGMNIIKKYFCKENGMAHSEWV